MDEIPPVRKAIGQRLLRALKEAGISQRELGRRLKKVPSAMNGWTTGRTQPSLEELAQIVAWTKKRADWIIGADPTEPDPASDPRVLARLLKQVDAGQRQIDAARAAAVAAGGVRERKR